MYALSVHKFSMCYDMHKVEAEFIFRNLLRFYRTKQITDCLLSNIFYRFNLTTLSQEVDIQKQKNKRNKRILPIKSISLHVSNCQINCAARIPLKIL